MTKAVEQSVFDAVSQIEDQSVSDFSLSPLAGDASDRRYFRASYKTGGNEKRLVVMDIMDVENICKSEEVTLYHDEKGELPFVNIHRFLDSIGAPVPEILYFNRKKGLMLLSDLGDDLLLDYVRGKDDEFILENYKAALDVLANMQIFAQEKKSGSDCMAFSQTYKTDLLVWEFEHYLEYGIEALYEIKVSASEKAELKKHFISISDKIADLPKAFCHRDFHSRNLIVHKGRIYMIDFQDALYGAMQYDLASLLRDSYIDLGDKMRNELIDYYVDRFEEKSGTKLNREQFVRGFCLVALQRNLKAAGRFVFIDKAKGNPKYLESIPRTLSYVANDAVLLKDHAPMFEIFGKYEKRIS